MSTMQFAKYKESVRLFLEQLNYLKLQDERMRDEHKHTDYCILWFMGTGEWACKLSYEETYGEYCEDLGKCCYMNDSLDLSD